MRGALIADSDMRRRDERFATQGRHQQGPDPLHDKTRKEPLALPIYQPGDFTHDQAAGTCVCPAGRSLYRAGRDLVTKGGLRSDRFKGTKRDCVPCARRAQCLRTPATTRIRQVAFFHGKGPDAPETHTARMQRKIDTPEGRAGYGQRFGTVEPVFANVRHTKRLDRFTLRGRTKVDGQWKLFCLVHNIEKLAHYGPRA